MKKSKNAANAQISKSKPANGQLEIGTGNTGNIGNNQTATALTVRLSEITFPEGVETLGDKANWLHQCSVELSKKSTGAAILAGWVLSVARSTCAYGQWRAWLTGNVSFSSRTADNYMSLYSQTIGAKRAAMRRPIALSVEPTVDELEAAAHDVDGKALSSLYKSTRLMAASGNWGGAGRGQGRKPKNGTLSDDEVAAKLDELHNSEAISWGIASNALTQLGKKDLIKNLSDNHIADVIKSLKNLLKSAQDEVNARLEVQP